jgi:dihydroorotase-like cyclic amidohydrolase
MSCFHDLLLKNAIVYTEGREIHNGYIKIKAGKIEDIGYVHDIDTEDSTQVISFSGAIQNGSGLY